MVFIERKIALVGRNTKTRGKTVLQYKIIFSCMLTYLQGYGFTTSEIFSGQFLKIRQVCF